MSEKEQALELALGQIERQFGRGAIMRLGEATQRLYVEAIPTGSISLDMALGVGGIPRGRIVEIFGAESAGKSTLSHHIVAEAQRKAEAALQEYTAALADARKEAGEIRDAAREDGKKIVAEAKDSAASEAARITASAHSQIEAERQAALVSLRGEVGTLALDLAGGVIGETLSDDAKAQAVVDRFLADLEAEKAAQ